MNSRASGVAGERLHGERTFANRAASCAKVLVLAGVQNCGMAALLESLIAARRRIRLRDLDPATEGTARVPCRNCRRYGRRPVEPRRQLHERCAIHSTRCWPGKTPPAAVTALLDRLLHHAHILKCGPRSWRTKVHTSLPTHDAVK